MVALTFPVHVMLARERASTAYSGSDCAAKTTAPSGSTTESSHAPNASAARARRRSDVSSPVVGRVRRGTTKSRETGRLCRIIISGAVSHCRYMS